MANLKVEIKRVKPHYARSVQYSPLVQYEITVFVDGSAVARGTATNHVEALRLKRRFEKEYRYVHFD